MNDIENDIVKFSRLLYRNDIHYVIEFEVNGELKLWYNFNNYQGWGKPKYFKEELSDKCILQKQKDLSYLFFKSPITHFEKDMPNVEDVDSMFEKSKDLIYFKSKMTNVKYTEDMFYGCSEEFLNLNPHLRDL